MPSQSPLLRSGQRFFRNRLFHFQPLSSPTPSTTFSAPPRPLHLCSVYTPAASSRFCLFLLLVFLALPSEPLRSAGPQSVLWVAQEVKL